MRLKSICQSTIRVFSIAVLFAGTLDAIAQQPSGTPAGAPAGTPAARPQSRLTPQSLIGDAVGDPASPQYSDIAEAISRITSGDLVGARQSLEAAVKKNPNLAPPSVLMAKMLFMANQGAAGRVELEKAVRDFPNDPEAYLIFAQLALQERQFTDADLLLTKAKALNDAYNANAKRKRNFDIAVSSGLAVVAEAREQWDTAIANWNKMLQLDPESIAAHQRLGVNQFRKGNGDRKAAEDAYKSFQAAMAIDSKANAEITLAELYQTTGDPTNAKTWTEFAVKKYPSDLRVQLSAARLAAQGNRLDEAQRYAEAAMKIDPESNDAKLLRAALARLSGDLPKAESLLEQLHLQSPSNLLAANMLAQVLVDQDNADKQRRGLELARMTLSAATEGSRTNRDMLATYGWALFRNGNREEAERVFQQVAGGGQLNQDLAYYVTKGLLEPRGQYPIAIRLLEDALKNAEPFPYRMAASELLADLKKRPLPSGDSTGGVPVVPEVAPSSVPGTTPTTTPMP